MGNLRPKSREEYGTVDEIPTHVELKTGCLLRIADSLETLAKSRDQLEWSHDFEKERANRLRARLDTEYRRSAALRGVIGRMKKKKKSKEASRE